MRFINTKIFKEELLRKSESSFVLIKSKKSQMKIQEMAFVLIALFLLFSMVFLFYIKLKSSDIDRTSYELKQNNALSMLGKIAAMPEFSCSSALGKDSLCMDEDKLRVMQDRKDYETLFKGIKEIKISKIYPSVEEFVIYSSNKEDYESYGAFTSICKQRYDNTGFYQCSMGVIHLSI